MRRTVKKLSLIVAVMAVALSCSGVAQADPPTRGPGLLTWHFEYFTQPLSIQFRVPPRIRRADLESYRSAIQRYLFYMRDELLRWESAGRRYPEIEPFADYLKEDSEMPAWYRRLQVRPDGPIGFSPADLNQRIDGSYIVPPNRTLP